MASISSSDNYPEVKPLKVEMIIDKDMLVATGKDFVKNYENIFDKESDKSMHLKLELIDYATRELMVRIEFVALDDPPECSIDTVGTGYTISEFLPLFMKEKMAHQLQSLIMGENIFNDNWQQLLKNVVARDECKKILQLLN